LIAEKEVKIKKEFVSRNKKDEKEEKGLGSLISDLERDLQIEIRDPNTELAPLIKEFRRQSESILAGDSQARLDMALAFFEMDLFLEAKDEISKIQKQDPYYVEAQFLLAQLFISEGSELGALEAYQKCFRASVKGSAPYFEALYQLSWTYFRLEDYSNSDFHLEELEKQKPDYRDSRTLRKRLDFLVQKKAG
jgi:tetratricopeptide (TPR) repeat protein